MTGPAPAVAAVRIAVRDALADVPAGSTVLVACSGGPDSLAVAAGLAFVGPRAGWRAGAVVVDHGLQAGSDEVAARAAAACRGLGLEPVVVRRVAVAGSGGPEASARRARYEALTAVAGETGAAAVLLGHTLDDQAETVLLGLARGSGLRSLSGMPRARGLFRRPLLDLRRAETLAACDAQGLDPWHDPTNASGANRRSRVRGELMPLLDEVLGPGAVTALARTADLAREQSDALDDLAADLLARAAGDGWDVAVLAAAPDGVRRAALRAAAVAAGATPGSLGRVHVLALDSLVVDWRGQGPVPLPGGIEGVRRCGRLFLQVPMTTT
ncbi:MAG TPA: tRNA lysidine(34) synthetase TilS [Cellulomonas sp.]